MMIMIINMMQTLPALFAALVLVSAEKAAAPTAKTRNGTYAGLYLPAWEQEVFLGMPYARPPVGELRYRRPQPIDEAFAGVRPATAYGRSCMQYGTELSISEDCLTINVVRPARRHNGQDDDGGKEEEEEEEEDEDEEEEEEDEKLPVLVWIYGGGLSSGSTADPQYNLSGIVRVSQEAGQPILGVSMNYRLGQWGFLQTPQILSEGSSNAGLLDQRLALHWIQENIAAFGGDPRRVVVWGESAGAQSIAYHLFAYEGRDDGIFQGAILESGGPTGAQVESLTWYAGAVENLTRSVGCGGVDVHDQLSCLRAVDSETLFAAQPSVVWNPLLDGDFLTAYPSQLMPDGKYVKVPLLTGANTDEGFAISGPDELETTEQIFDAVFSWRGGYALTPPTVRKLLELYPDDPCHEPPHAITNCSRNPARGAMWRRAAAIGSDLVMIAGRRRMAELYATSSDHSVYSYRFGQRPWNGDVWDGVKHFDNVAFSFQNISGLLGPSPAYDSHARLARAIGEAYVGFVNHFDPNLVGEAGLGLELGLGLGLGDGNNKGDRLLPQWPAYDVQKPRNMVLNATLSWVEDDDWRREGIAYIGRPDVAKELLS
ncbi:alpha/beta-hydrolase [Xylaria sp. CBS 124048]|nr:alpha/beta-hydrolase [Xylaria sp. CBS 124048]